MIYVFLNGNSNKTKKAIMLAITNGLASSFSYCNTLMILKKKINRAIMNIINNLFFNFIIYPLNPYYIRDLLCVQYKNI